MQITPQEIEKYIEKSNLSYTSLEIKGDGRHFFAVIVSQEFEGLQILQRHRKIYSILAKYMKTEIHAISLKTLTPREFITSQLDIKKSKQIKYE